MLTPWVLVTGIIFDTRSILIGVAGLFFGTVPTLIAIAVTAAFRIFQGGSAVWMGVSVIVTSGIIGIVWRRQLHKPLENLTGFELLLFGLVIHIVMLLCAFVLPFQTAKEIIFSIFLPVLLIYPIGTLLLGMLMINRLHREHFELDLKQSNSRMSSLVKILQYPVKSTQEFLDYTLDQAIRLTESKIGYIYYYEEERKEFVLNSWSKEVLEECKVVNPQSCYELDKTGFWGETVRQRKTMILNNFQADHPLKKGVPAGHVKLLKFMTVPIFSGERIVAVIGMANKESDYDEMDVLQLQLLMDGVWKYNAQKQAETNLQKSEEQKKAIIDNLPNALIHIFDRDFRYVYNSGAGMQQVGLNNEMLVGKTIFEVLGPELGTEVSGYYQQVLGGKKVHFEGNFAGQDFIIHAVPLLDEQGNVVQILALSLNITDLKQTERQLLETQTELQKMVEVSDQSRLVLLNMVEDQQKTQEDIQRLNVELEQRVLERTYKLEIANKELEAFSYSVSHDLRAPLRAVDGFSSALLTDYQNKLDDKGKHYLERIREGTQKMGRLIEDLLKLSRVTRREMIYEPVNLSNLTIKLSQEFQDQEQERVIEFAIAPNLLVHADADLMEIAMENLLSNAVKFSAKRSPAHILVGMTEQSEKNIYFVRDDGVGFDMAYADKLFTPFQRMHSEQDYPGTGIGLVTVQRIISRHGGRIWFESEVDQGATFYFTLGE